MSSGDAGPAAFLYHTARADPAAVSRINPRLQPGARLRVVTGIPGKTGVGYTLDRKTGEPLCARPTVAQNVISAIDGATGAVTENAEVVFRSEGQEVMARPTLAGAQPTPYNLKYRTGQTVQPIFEGWSRKPDGGFTMHFGYFNRNFVEEVHVPVGPDNHFDPGVPDSGQPTFFYPRAYRRMFSIDVPGDFGDRRLVWHLTTQGESLRAIGWLEPTWETAARSAGGRRLSPEAARNTAPAIEVETAAAVAVEDGVALLARVTDDGLPVVREIDPNRRVRGTNDPPTLQRGQPHNVPSVPNRRGSGVQQLPHPRPARVVDRLAGTGRRVVRAGPDGHHRGRTAVTAAFAAPGDYVLSSPW